MTAVATRAQSARGSAVKATMRAGARRAQHALDDAQRALHRGAVLVGRAERRVAGSAQRAGRGLARGARRHPLAAALLVGFGTAFVLLRRGPSA